MKSYSSREVIQMLKKDGWYEYGCDGDHRQFKHPVKKGKVTVTHPKKDFPLPTIKSIERQSGVKFP
jgi:predicted RNA binding protein YcfA (HicA-like mRNA interferase family)